MHDKYKRITQSNIFKEVYNNKSLGEIIPVDSGIQEIVDEHFWEMLGEDPIVEDVEKASLRLCPLPPCYNEEQRKSEAYAESWQRARDEQCGFKLGAFWQKKQMLHIACEWLRNHLINYWYKEDNYFNISGCIYEFKEAMKSINEKNNE